MCKQNSPIAYLGQDTLNRLADKNALDDYLKKQNVKKDGADIKFLMTPKLRGFVQKLIFSLPQNDKKLILMRYWDDLSVEDIAHDNGIEKAVVQDRLSKILAVLKSKILDQLKSKEEATVSPKLYQLPLD